MKADSLIEENDQLRKQLTPENKQYYEELMTYIRANSTFKSDLDVEQILLDILNDILEAQSNNQTAQSYFGKNPKESADDILKSLPRNLTETLKFALSIALGYIVVFMIPSLTTPGIKTDLGNLIIMGIVSFILANIILWLVGQTIYQRKVVKFVIDAIAVLLFAAVVAGSIFLKTPLSFETNGTVGIILIAIVFLIMTYIYIGIFKHRMPWTIIYVVLTIDAIIGVLSRIPVIGRMITDPVIPKSTLLWILIPGCIIAALIGGVGTYYWLTKHDEN
ncbi:hypothetical protein [Lentilactobacillus kefiri]|uniref:Uncharacterized protein n=3 Tax=Lentilactobacillus kefiri TaxID=33962 RepID=A0A8E1RKF8_LENKE|nr:hypothetical protein [Lentilactobacillus kefiri]KRL72258.1 hypothetical protein FD08_GL004178 [Lentilactobacillus parakefiri DSM 10551]KRM53905.1 hypothetical protein FC95_GL000097 [Lentilactobacillus kefiri DSM 20587 = JCM 5818]MCP9368796.1 hypothetical protein [Lentilactobacillus kefiri]MDM7492487.1 hypothetical protein [Lentilactobacillus kefiri]PAK59435.1 hypothetical protein B9K02_06150 [Lentilactobacillus kefiri]